MIRQVEPDPITLAALRDLLEVDRRLEAGTAYGVTLAKLDPGKLTWHAHINEQAWVREEEWHPALVALARTFEREAGFFHADDGGGRYLVRWRAELPSVRVSVRRIRPSPRALGEHILGVRGDFKMVQGMVETLA